MNGFSTWVLAALLTVGQSAEPVAPPKQNVVREGDRLIFSPSVTDQELQAFPPSPEIRGIFFAEGPNRWKSTLTAAGLESLARWTNLQSLGLPDGVVTDEILLKLSPLTQLRSFDLMGIRYGASVTVRGLAVLSSFPHLRELRLDGLALTDEGMKSIVALPALTDLRLENTRITDKTLSLISAQSSSALPRLEHLSLRGTAVTDEAIARLKTARPTLILFK